jgi:hypothetical protein
MFWFYSAIVLQNVEILVDGLGSESIKSNAFLNFTIFRLDFRMLVNESGYPIYI